MKKVTYTITLSEEQIQVLRTALDFYERVLGLGQLEEIEYHWRWYADVKNESFDKTSQALKGIIHAMKVIGWNLYPNESYGIHSEQIKKPYRIAYDMTQIIRKAMSDVSIARAKNNNDEDLLRYLKGTVDRNDYYPTYPELEPIKVTINIEEED